MNNKLTALPGLPSRSNQQRLIYLALLLAAAWIVGSGCYYVVQPNEMAGVRRLGTVVTAQLQIAQNTQPRTRVVRVLTPNGETSLTNAPTFAVK